MRLRGTGIGNIPLPSDLFPYFAAPRASNLSIQFYGMFSGCKSFDNVCSAMARELAGEVASIGLCSYNGTTFFDRRLQPYSRRDPDADIAILYSLPERRRLPPDFRRHAIHIGGFVCETDGIHEKWVRVCNDFDLICVPSKFCRRAFVDSGVTAPVYVVPHGLEPEYRAYHQPPPPAPFVFYNTFDAGSYPERKGAEELIRCFCRTFDPGDDVRLLLRTQNNARMFGLVRRYDHHGMVKIEPPRPLTVDEFARQYSDVHCVVHPSKGEGFGLIPFQAIACERPVIAPAVTGMADYLDASNALPLRTKGKIKGIALGNQTGHYYSIDEEHLCHLMRRVYDDWPSDYLRVRRAAPAYRKKHQWSRTLRGLTAILQGLTSRDRTVTDIPGLVSELIQDLPDSETGVRPDAASSGYGVPLPVNNAAQGA